MAPRPIPRTLLSLATVALFGVAIVALAALGQALSGSLALANLKTEIQSAGAKWSFADYGIKPGEVRGEGFDDWVAAVNRLAEISVETSLTVGSIFDNSSEIGSERSLLAGSPQDHGIKEGLAWPDVRAAYAPVREAFHACVTLAATRDISYRPAYDSGVVASFPHLSPTLSLARVGNQLVQLDLATSGPETALETAEHLQTTLAASRSGHPVNLIELLVTATIRQSLLQSFRAILLAPNLSPTSLDRLGALLPPDSLLAQLQTALEGERALNLLWIHDQIRGAPLSHLAALSPTIAHPDQPEHRWLNWLFLAFYRPLFLDTDTAHTARLLWNEEQRLRLLSEGGLSVPEAYANNPSPDDALEDGYFPPRLLARLLLPTMVPAFRRTFFCETRERQAWIALALKRHHQTHGTYPETLNQLDLTTARVLHDPVTSQPMHYRRQTKDAYTLYSVGWNGVDDGGRRQPRKKPDGDGHLSEQQADDWLWPRPSTPPSLNPVRDAHHGQPSSGQPATP